MGKIYLVTSKIKRFTNSQKTYCSQCGRDLPDNQITLCCGILHDFKSCNFTYSSEVTPLTEKEEPSILKEELNNLPPPTDEEAIRAGYGPIKEDFSENIL